MASISNHQVQQVNLILIPETPIDLGRISADSIVARLQSIFEDGKVTRTQLPEILVILDPVSQISVNVLESENRIIIADTQPAAYTANRLNNFLRFAHACAQLVSGNAMKAYGFNISSVFDLEDTADSGQILSSIFIKELESFDHAINAAGVKLIYNDSDGVRCQLALDPRFGKDLAVTKSINANFNVHRPHALPEYAVLLEQCQRDYDNFGSNLTQVLSEDHE